MLNNTDQPQQRRRKTAILTLEGLQRLEAAKLNSKFWHSESSYTLESLNELTGLSPHTISKIHSREIGVDLRSLVRYFDAFNLNLELNDYIQPIREKNETAQISSVEQAVAEPLRNQTTVCWGMAPDVSRFCGRAAELAELKRWMVEDRCRLITLFGMSGIGKTYLATKLAEQNQHEFQTVIWRSLQPPSQSYSPVPFSHFLDDLIHSLTTSASAISEATSTPISAKIRQLISLLSQTRCLLILDQVESVLEQPAAENISTEHVLLDFEAYGNLFKYLAQGRHQSCIILTSRIYPSCFQSIFDDTLWSRPRLISGLSLTEAKQIFDGYNFEGTDGEWKFLVNYYNGNPLILGTVAKTIQQLFNNSITSFLRCHAFIFNDICEIIEQQMQSLSILEKTLIRVLSVQSAPISLTELRSQLSAAISTANIIESLKSLRSRSLVEGRAYYSLCPLFQDYMGTHFRSNLQPNLKTLAIANHKHNCEQVNSN